jgi:hypothetical protein
MKKIVKSYSKLPIELKKPMTEAAQSGMLQRISFNFKGVDRPAYFYTHDDTEYLIVMDESQSIFIEDDDDDNDMERDPEFFEESEIE